MHLNAGVALWYLALHGGVWAEGRVCESKDEERSAERRRPRCRHGSAGLGRPIFAACNSFAVWFHGMSSSKWQ